MGKPKIAPMLTLIVQALGVDDEDRFEAARELRALKAVALRGLEMPQEQCWMCANLKPDPCSFHRALARLSRSTGRGTR